MENVPFANLKDIEQDYYSKKNIILYYSNSFINVDRPDYVSFIGFFEKNQHQIGVFDSKDRIGYWISDISGITNILREAIDFWNTTANFTEEEREEAMQKELLADAEAEANRIADDFWEEMHDMGLIDEDFGF